jgi:hypothetical protein
MQTMQSFARLSARSLAPILFASLAAVAGAQEVPLWVSTSADVLAPDGSTAFADEELLLIQPAAAPRAVFAGEHWLACTGFTPGDVDAAALRPGKQPGSAASLAFSLLANEGDVADGDVLGLAPGGGLEVLISEFELVTQLGVPGANIDVDAIAFDDQGRLIFSLQSDLSSTILGDVLDGDVLSYGADIGVVRLMSEVEVQAYVTAATGLTSAIGDVLGLEWVNGEIWVSVQAPSSIDGSVIACGAFPRVVLDESTAGLGGAELDALLVPGLAAAPTVLSFTPAVSAPGTTVTASIQSNAPASPQAVIVAGAAGWVGGAPAGGFGDFYVDPLDPWLATALSGPGLTVVVLDGQGAYAADLVLPAGVFGGTGFGLEAGWTFQLFDLLTLSLSAPARIAL